MLLSTNSLILITIALAVGLTVDCVRDNDSKTSINVNKTEVNDAEYNKLTADETRVIIDKGTERPFTGKFTDHYDSGIYTCRQCGAKLFESTAKFHSDCGWPSFDDKIDGAVKQLPDTDGMRIEILCTNCNGHLGHVFTGEMFTPKNTRYCVNSISMDFIPSTKNQNMTETNQQTAIFASGCFWGTEYFLQKAPGVISTTAGFSGGHIDQPTYKQVCTGETGHAEAVEVIFDPTKTSYEKLVKLFFETHDFTQLNRQGPDVGHQYRSGIFYLNDDQKKVAQQHLDLLVEMGYEVKTESTAATEFWPAENYHQDYYDNNQKTPYCHIYKKIF